MNNNGLMLRRVLKSCPPAAFVYTANNKLRVFYSDNNNPRFSISRRLAVVED